MLKFVISTNCAFPVMRGSLGSGSRARRSCYACALPFTARENEIVRFTLGGISQKEIASRMAISHATVKAHDQNRSQAGPA
jgi:DNA-binding NarL/FixJ family response regulator